MEIAKALIELSKDSLLHYTSVEEIYNHYLSGELVVNRAFSSPFRKDKNPSFVINQKSMYYKDYSTGDSGDVFSFVQQIYQKRFNFYETLGQIASDMNLDHNFIMADRKVEECIKVKVENVSKRGSFNGDFKLEVKVRKLKQHDIDYWESFGINEKYLRLGKVFPISYYFINGKQYKAEKFAYVYVEVKDGKESYKVYQPFSSVMKWINNNDYSVWELWRLLPETYDKIIITSSRKDALSIISNYNVPATSFQAESINPKAHVVKQIQDRFEKVYLLYDNDFDNPDNPGQMLAEKRINQFGFTNLIIPEKYGCKDFSDLVHDHGIIKSCMILAEVIKEADKTDKYNPISA